MDIRRSCRNATLAALLLANGAAYANGSGGAVDQRTLFAPMRQTLRFTTQLVRVHAPAAPATTSVTTGVRG